MLINEGESRPMTLTELGRHRDAKESGTLQSCGVGTRSQQVRRGSGEGSKAWVEDMQAKTTR